MIAPLERPDTPLKESPEMHAGKIVILLWASALPSLALAGEAKNPLERVEMATTGATCFISFVTLGTTAYPFEAFKSAKNDALAFVGSDGEIRGVRMEQAVRVYHEAYPPPHLSDIQFAQAITAAY